MVLLGLRHLFLETHLGFDFVQPKKPYRDTGEAVVIEHVGLSGLVAFVVASFGVGIRVPLRLAPTRFFPETPLGLSLALAGGSGPAVDLPRNRSGSRFLFPRKPSAAAENQDGRAEEDGIR